MLQLMVNIESIRTMADGGVQIKLSTMELPPTELATLFALRGGQFWGAFCETVVRKEDLQIPEYITGKEEKSPSERLRSRMAAYFKEKHGTFDGFPTWYANALDELGQKYLSKID